MAELPERKVLKETLIDLKAKTIRSRSSVATSIKTFIDTLDEIKQKTEEIHKSQKEQVPHGPAEAVSMYITTIEKWFIDLASTYFSALDDESMYIKLLENYSTELDKTLYDAIEAGKKKAENQTEEQNKLMGGSKSSYVA